MTTWQPIDTAPKDGTGVLLWDAKRNVVVSGCWHVQPTSDTPNGYDPGWAWWAADDDVIVWDDDTGPSHWMPLPEPPTF